MSPFADRTVIVTGASSGLGEALALALAAQGARLALHGRSRDKLADVAARCRERGARALACAGNVTQPEDSRELVAATVAEYGSLDYFIANAGISMWARFEDVADLDVFKRLVEVNYLGAVYGVHFALPHLRRSRGMVVAISSIQAKIGVPLHTGYVASKHALQGFCEALRMELEGTGVDVLTVLPHWLKGTELRQHALGADGHELGASSRKHSRESVTVATTAAAILDAMRRRRRELIMPWKLKLLLGLNLVRPRWAEAIINGAVRKQNA